MYNSIKQLIKSLTVIDNEKLDDVELITFSDGNGRLYSISVPLINGKKEGRADLVYLGSKVATLSYKNDQISGECILYGCHGEVVQKQIVGNDWNVGPYTRFDHLENSVDQDEYTDNIQGFTSTLSNPNPYRARDEFSVSDFSRPYSESNHSDGFDGGSLLGVLGVIATAAAVGYGVKKASDYFSRDNRSKQSSKQNQTSRPGNSQNRNRQYNGYPSSSPNRPTEQDNPFRYFF